MSRSFPRFRAFLGLLLAALACLGLLGRAALAGPGATITGLVRDSSGKLLPGTQVRLRLGNLTAVTRADADGIYSFSPVPGASGYALRASLPRYVTAELGPFTVAGGEVLRVDFALVRAGRQPQGSITGTVRSASGAPVGGALVEVLSGPSDSRATTNRSGKFRLRGLQPGSYALSVSARTTGAAVLEGISVGARTADVAVQLDEPDEAQPGTLFGTVKDDAGHALPGATVEIVSGPSTGSAVTGDGGRYEIGSLAAGTYTLRASAEGYWGNTWDQVLLAAGHEVRVDFALHRQEEPPRFGSIAGQVTDGEGQPLAGAHVVVLEGPRFRSVETNEEGRYTLPELLPGGYLIQASKDGYVPRSEDGTVTAGATLTLNFQLLRADPLPGRLRGRVTNAEGAGVAGATVQILEGPSTTTNAEGNYELNGLAPGERSVRVSKDGYQTVTRTGVVIHAGEPTVLDVRLERVPTTGRLVGVVRDAVTHEAIAGAVVKVLEGPQATTGPAGGFELSGVAPGLRTVQVTREGYRTLVQEHVAITAGETTRLELQLSKAE